MYLVQIWALPGFNDLHDPVHIGTNPEIDIKRVPIKQGALLTTLLQTKGTQPTLQECAQVDIARLGVVLSRLSFNTLTQFNVISARVIKTDKGENGCYEEMNCAGAPAGISLFEYKVGFQQNFKLDSSFLSGDVPYNIDSAITWFINGNNSINSVQQFIYHWIGLELLAPEIVGPWRCGKCGQDVPTCPVCGRETTAPKAVIKIRDYLIKKLGVTRNQFQKYYDLRCMVSHGQLPFSQEAIDELSRAAIDIQQLLLRAIKLELDWPNEALPAITPEGMTIIGQPWLIGTCQYADEHSFDLPACLPF